MYARCIADSYFYTACITSPCQRPSECTLPRRFLRSQVPFDKRREALICRNYPFETIPSIASDCITSAFPCDDVDIAYSQILEKLIWHSVILWQSGIQKIQVVLYSDIYISSLLASTATNQYIRATASTLVIIPPCGPKPTNFQICLMLCSMPSTLVGD